MTLFPKQLPSYQVDHITVEDMTSAEFLAYYNWLLRNLGAEL